MDVAEKPWPVFDSNYFAGLLLGGMNLPLNGFLVNLETHIQGPGGRPKVSLILTTTFPFQNGFSLELVAYK